MNKALLLTQVVVLLDNELIFVKHHAWKDFENYLKKLLEKEVNKLIFTTNPDEKSVVQGRAQAYTTLLGLRGQVE